MTRPQPSFPPWLQVLAAVLTFVTTFGIGVFSGLNRADEAWFLLLADRVASGDALYTDVAFPTTPLSVWLMAALVALGGAEIVLLRALIAACVAGSALLAVSSIRVVGGSRTAGALAGAMVLVTSALPAGSLYQRLATLLAQAALLALLIWLQDRRRHAPLAWAGLAAGLCVATKHNLGALIGLLVLGLVVLGAPRLQPTRQQLAAALGPMVAVPLLSVAVVAITGDLRGFVDHVITGAGQHARDAGLSYLEGIRPLWGGVSGDSALQRLDGRWVAAGFLLPPLAGLGLLAVLWSDRTGPERRLETLAWLGVVLAAIATLYPRADTQHVTLIMPIVLSAIGYAAVRLVTSRPRLARPAVAIAFAWVAAGTASVVGNPLLDVARGELEVSRVPHFRWIPAAPDDIADANRMRNELRGLAGPSGSLLLLVPEAPYGYLVSDLRVNGPFDFPITTLLGTSGTRRLMNAVRNDQFAGICLRRRWNEFVAPLRPADVERLVRSRLRPVRDSATCEVFR